MEEERDTEVLLIDVPEDSILAHKKLEVRPVSKMRLKHLRAYQRVAAAGRNADMDDLALAMQGALIGWSEDDIDELTLDEMLLVIGELDRHKRSAIPNGNGSSS